MNLGKELSGKLVNMKQPKSERLAKEVTPADKQLYPYGLTVSLEDNSLQKLKLKTLPEVGDEMTLVAKVKVTRVSSDETDKGANKSVSLQITSMRLD